MSLGSLQEELEKLQLEKQALVKATSDKPSNEDDTKEETANFRKIVDKVLKYKKLLPIH